MTIEIQPGSHILTADGKRAISADGYYNGKTYRLTAEAADFLRTMDNPFAQTLLAVVPAVGGHVQPPTKRQ